MVNGVIAKLNREQLKEEIRSISKDLNKTSLRLNRCCSGNYDRDAPHEMYASQFSRKRINQLFQCNVLETRRLRDAYFDTNLILKRRLIQLRRVILELCAYRNAKGRASARQGMLIRELNKKRVYLDKIEDDIDGNNSKVQTKSQ